MATLSAGLIAVAFVVLMAWLFRMISRATNSSGTQMSAKAAVPAVEHTQDEFFELKGKGVFGIEAVGESHYQTALKAAVAGRRGYVEVNVEAELYCEDNNAFDGNAVRVMIGGQKVGYLNRVVAMAYRDIIKNAGFGKATGRCQAKIFGGSNDKPSYGVWLDI